MGRAYSINGFLNATLRRSNKTLLVEGPSDKQAMHRLALERFPERAGDIAIDHAGILDDRRLAGLGNKARVMQVQASADALRGIDPRISLVLATLTDREWDGLTFTQYAPDPHWLAPTQLPNRFVTFGHSIENYYFEFECVREYLKYAFAEHVTAGFLSTLENAFAALLVLATVLTIRMRDDQAIARCNGLIHHSHFENRNQRFYLNATFGHACNARGIAVGNTIVTNVNADVDTAWDRLHADTSLKWLPHGHIGDDVMWAAIAHIAYASGVPQHVADDISRGHKRDRERFNAQWLSKALPEKRRPLDESVEWLHS